MFDIKRMRKGLTVQEKQLKSDVEARRAVFEMDRYVNISEVHGIVKDALNDLYDKLQISQKVAR